MQIIKQGKKMETVVFDCSVCECVFAADPFEYNSILLAESTLCTCGCPNCKTVAKKEIKQSNDIPENCPWGESTRRFGNLQHELAMNSMFILRALSHFNDRPDNGKCEILTSADSSPKKKEEKE